MKKNVGGFDYVLRLIAGIAIIAWGYSAKNWWGVVGLIPLITALASYCPAYSIFGISTRSCCCAESAKDKGESCCK